MSEIEDFLLPIEPEYDQVANLGPDVVPKLIELVKLNDPLLSSRATYALGRVGAAIASGKIPASAINNISEGLQEAAKSELDLVRVAAAAATHGLPSQAAEPVQLILLDDPDIGVRRTVLEALKPDAAPAVVFRIEKWANEEPSQEVKELALIVVEKTKKQK